MASKSPPSSAMGRQLAQDEEQGPFDDAGFEMMGSHMMGGAPLPAMSSAERARFTEGITLRAKFVGKIEVPAPRGHAMLMHAIQQVRSHHKSQGENKVKQWFVVSTTGLKIIDTDQRLLRDTYALHQISFIAALPSNKKVFGFVTVNNSVQPPVYTAHVFKSTSKAELIINTIGQCFTLAVEEQRKLKQRQQNRGSQRPTSMNPAAFTGDLPNTFAETIVAMKVLLQTYQLSAPHKSFFGRAFQQLESMHGYQTRTAQIAERQAEAVQREKADVVKQYKQTLQLCDQLRDRLRQAA